MISPRQLASQLRDRIAPGAVILLYHRVADLDFDPQKLAVSTKNFAAHLEVLQQTATTVPLTELQPEIRRRGKARGLAAVTFDDGYADNLLSANPELRKRGIPATVFVASGYCTNAREFWWDELERILLAPGSLPSTLSLTIGGQTFTRAIEPLDHHPNWDVEQPDPSSRHTLYRDLHRALRLASVETRERAMAELRNWASVPDAPRDSHRPLTPHEVRELHSDVVTVGAHTVTHPRLSQLDRNAQQHEIAMSRAELEALTGTPITTFAYPYGGTADYNRDSVELARGTFALACSNFRGTVRANTSSFELPRVLVRNWSGGEFRARLAPLLSP